MMPQEALSQLNARFLAKIMESHCERVGTLNEELDPVTALMTFQIKSPAEGHVSKCGRSSLVPISKNNQKYEDFALFIQTSG